MSRILARLFDYRVLRGLIEDMPRSFKIKDEDSVPASYCDSPALKSQVISRLVHRRAARIPVYDLLARRGVRGGGIAASSIPAKGESLEIINEIDDSVIAGRYEVSSVRGNMGCYEPVMLLSLR